MHRALLVVLVLILVLVVVPTLVVVLVHNTGSGKHGPVSPTLLHKH
jgi:hypothetical protein